MSYPEHFQLVRRMMGALGKEIPHAMAPFGQLHQGAVGQGALDRKTKELIALALSVEVKCDACIAYHVHDALDAGATREEILDVMGVNVLMGGAPAVAQATKVLEALKQFTEREN